MKKYELCDLLTLKQCHIRIVVFVELNKRPCDGNKSGQQWINRVGYDASELLQCWCFVPLSDNSNRESRHSVVPFKLYTLLRKDALQSPTNTIPDYSPADFQNLQHSRG